MKLEQIQLIRGTNISSLTFLRPKLLVENEEEREQVGNFLEETFSRFPENVFILLAFDKKTDDLLGFLIAFISIDAGVFVHQCWSTNKLATKLLFHKVIVWGMSKGCPTIALQTKRKAMAMAKITGMQVVSTVLGARLDDEFEEQFMHKLNLEIQNGQGQQSTEFHSDNVFDGSTTESVEDTGGLLQPDSTSADGAANQELSEGECPSSVTTVHERNE